MKSLFFIRQVFNKFPLLILANIFLLLLVGFMECVTLFSLVAVADLFLNPGLKDASQITQSILTICKFIGIPTTLSWILAFLLIFTLLKTYLQIFSFYMIARIQYAVLKDIMLGTFNDFFNARWYFFSSGNQGTLLNTFLREITIVGDAFGAMSDYFATIIQSILFLVVPLYISWQVTLSMGIIILILTMPFLLLGKVGNRLGNLTTSTANKITKVIQESLSSAKIILGFGNTISSKEALRNSYNDYCKASLKYQVLKNSIPLAFYPGVLVVLIIGLYISRKITLPLSETLALFYALSRVIPLIGKIVHQKFSLENFFPSYEQIMNLRQRAKELKQPSGDKKFTGFNKEIFVEKLSFAFPNHEPVLNNINMVIPKGKMIAVVGVSGVGKSTFVDMIMRFNDPICGNIIIDGVNLQDYDVNSYRQRIGYVPQDVILFNMTIRDNLLWANEIASDNEISVACQQANAEEFIVKLPKGYNTLVGDRGVRLSGGQVQRIALARAILRKPEILILDEATSNLDTYSERLIQQATEDIAKETTVIVVAHRLSTIKNADYIYVLRNGRVEEEGTYSELVQKNGHFYHMVNLQTLETVKQKS